jgi:hypothetical protein
LTYFSAGLTYNSDHFRQISALYGLQVMYDVKIPQQ